jgi:hypothetical protein
MYENIGEKIKILAKVLFAVLSALGVIGGIVVLSLDEGLEILAVLLIFLLPLIAWISSWCLYGFGEIIDKLTDIEDNTRKSLINSVRNSQLDIKTEEKLKGLYEFGLISEE